MTMFTYCPNTFCDRKVKLYPLADGPGVNFCCLNCWNFLSASMSEEPYEEDKHSAGCDKRWQAREHEEVVEIDGPLIIMGPAHHAEWRNASPVPEVR